MYAVAKEHRNTKLLTKVRRVPSILETNNNNDNQLNCNLNNHQDNQQSILNDICSNKQNSSPTSTPKTFQYYHRDEEQEVISVQHQAMIRYINDSWRHIQQELESSNNQQTINNRSNNSTSTSLANCTASSSTTTNNNQTLSKNIKNNSGMVKIRHINGSTTSQIPKNFVPFDLESFFGQRFIQKLLQSS